VETQSAYDFVLLFDFRLYRVALQPYAAFGGVKNGKSAVLRLKNTKTAVYMNIGI